MVLTLNESGSCEDCLEYSSTSKAKALLLQPQTVTNRLSPKEK